MIHTKIPEKEIIMGANHPIPLVGGALMVWGVDNRGPPLLLHLNFYYFQLEIIMGGVV